MSRREFIWFMASAALLPASVHAQQPDRKNLIGILNLGSPGGELGDRQRALFRNTLSKLGWSEGKNYNIVPNFGQ